jgi:hypothetical protein
VRHDGASGDKVTIFDALFIAQYLAGAKDRGGLVCLNSAARFDKWNHAAVR